MPDNPFKTMVSAAKALTKRKPWNTALEKDPSTRAMVTGHHFQLDLFVDGEPLDVNTLVSRSTCLLGMSGSGKTSAVGRIAEQLISLNACLIAFDTEGELGTLTEINKNVIVHTLRSIPDDATIRRQMAWIVRNRKQVIFQFPTTVDSDERRRFLYHCLKQLYALEDELYSQGFPIPVFVLVDEIQDFVPEYLSADLPYGWPLRKLFGDAARQGRKRGVALIVATQRSADTSKKVLSQTHTKILMKASQYDVKGYRDAIKVLRDDKLIADLTRQAMRLSPGEAILIQGKNVKTVKFKFRDSTHISKTPKFEDYSNIDQVNWSQFEMEPMEG